MIQYYCIPSCDKCRLARKLLNERGMDYQEIDMRKHGINQAQIDDWIAQYGVNNIVNFRSTTWRALTADEQSLVQSDENAARYDIIARNFAILRRPILDFGDKIFTDKSALDWLKNS